MQPPPQPDPELAQAMQSLQEEIKELEAEQVRCEQEARRLMEQEVTLGQSHAGEVFNLKQRKQMLATEIQHLRVRLNHLAMSVQPMDDDERQCDG